MATKHTEHPTRTAAARGGATRGLGDATPLALIARRGGPGLKR